MARYKKGSIHSNKASAVSERKRKTRVSRDRRGAVLESNENIIPIVSLSASWVPPAECFVHNKEHIRSRWKQRPKVSTLKWFEENVVITGRTSNFKGKFNVSLFPYEAGVFEAFDDIEVQEVSLDWATQLGKSFIIQNLLGRIADSDPAPILFACADRDMAKDVANERIYPALEAIPKIEKRLLPEARRDSFKIDTGDCSIYMGWSGSPASLGQRSCKYVFCTELSKWNTKKSAEADSGDLVRERVKAFFGSKIIYEGTKTVEGRCRIEKLERRATQRLIYKMPCPFCGKYQEFDFKQLKWDKGPDGKNNRDIAEATAWYECANCKEIIKNHHKVGMLRAGVWAESGADVVLDDVQGGIYWTPGKKKARVHFHLWSIYSPLLSFGDVAGEFCRCTEKDNGNIGLQNFVNSWLAECWTNKIREYRWEELKNRIAVKERRGIIPHWTLFLTAGVDFQKGWGVYIVRAWGTEGRSRLVDWGQFTRKDELETLLFGRVFPCEGREPMRIYLAGLDSGYDPYNVYMFVNECNVKYGPCARAVKGGPSRTTYWMTPLEASGADGKKIPGGAELWNINDHYWKSFITGKYALQSGMAGSWEVPADVDENYMRSITAEVLQESENKRTGGKRFEWVLVDTVVKNHFFDAEKIAAVCADMCKINTWGAAVNVGQVQVKKEDAEKVEQFLEDPQSFWN